MFRYTTAVLGAVIGIGLRRQWGGNIGDPGSNVSLTWDPHTTIQTLVKTMAKQNPCPESRRRIAHSVTPDDLLYNAG